MQRCYPKRHPSVYALMQWRPRFSRVFRPVGTAGGLSSEVIETTRAFGHLILYFLQQYCLTLPLIDSRIARIKVLCSMAIVIFASRKKRSTERFSVSLKKQG